MLDGWYCRTVGNESVQVEDEEQIVQESKFKKEYKYLKRKFQNLIYENEAFQQALRKAQKRLLQVTRDRSFLLDRLLMHEKFEHSTSESEQTESSDEEPQHLLTPKIEVPQKRRKIDPSLQLAHHPNASKTMAMTKKKRPAGATTANAPVVTTTRPIPTKLIAHPQIKLEVPTTNVLTEGHMTPEEVERHLQSQSFLDLLPERAPPTVPTEMFSNEPSLDSESNDMFGEFETSPSNLEDEISIDMLQE